jgi:tetratricopeptide (TPR) repeat protein
MNTKDFIQLLNDENAVKNLELKQLDSVLENFPFFQSARMLYLRNLKINNNFLFNSYLKTTASYVGDRTVLFEYITKEFEVVEEAETLIKVEEEINRIEEASSEERLEEGDKNKKIVDVEKKKNVTDEIINFSANDRFSFNEWLQLSNVKEIHRRIDEKIEESNKKEDKISGKNSKFDLIDKFIETNPRLKPKAKDDVVSGNIALSGTKENEGWMTETLAQVYIEQKKYSKAIKAYKILGLKYPEKSGFFADRIRAIKKLSEN